MQVYVVQESKFHEIFQLTGYCYFLLHLQRLLQYQYRDEVILFFFNSFFKIFFLIGWSITKIQNKIIKSMKIRQDYSDGNSKLSWLFCPVKLLSFVVELLISSIFIKLMARIKHVVARDWSHPLNLALQEENVHRGDVK